MSATWPPTADEMRRPDTHTCGAVRSCTRRAAGTARVGHAVVWACTDHREDD